MGFVAGGERVGDLEGGWVWQRFWAEWGGEGTHVSGFWFVGPPVEEASLLGKPIYALEVGHILSLDPSRRLHLQGFSPIDSILIR